MPQKLKRHFADLGAWSQDESGPVRVDALLSIFLKGATGSFIAKLIAAGLLFLAQVVLARALGAGHYGVYVYALSWMTILAIFAKMGFETSLLRFLPEYSVKRQWPLFRGIIRFSFSIVGLAAVAIFVVGQLVLSLLRRNLDPELLLSFRIMLFVLPLFAWTAIRQSCLRGLKHVVQAEAPEGLFRPLALIAAVLLLAGRVHALDATWAWAAHLFAVSLSFLYGTVLLVRALPAESRRARPIAKRLFWLQVSAPMLLMNSMNIVMSQASIVILGFFKPAEEVALFSASVRIVTLATFALLAVNSIAAPMISELYYANKKAELQTLLRFSALGIAIVTAIAALALILGGRWILGLFGHEFVGGYLLLVTMLGGFVIKSCAGPASYVLNLTGHQNITARAMTVAAILSLALSFLLIPRWGAFGAALASAVTMAFWNMTLLVLNIKVVGFDPSIGALFRSPIRVKAKQL